MFLACALGRVLTTATISAPITFCTPISKTIFIITCPDAPRSILEPETPIPPSTSGVSFEAKAKLCMDRPWRSWWQLRGFKAEVLGGNKPRRVHVLPRLGDYNILSFIVGLYSVFLISLICPNLHSFRQSDKKTSKPANSNGSNNATRPFSCVVYFGVSGGVPLTYLFPIFGTWCWIPQLQNVDRQNQTPTNNMKPIYIYSNPGTLLYLRGQHLSCSDEMKSEPFIVEYGRSEWSQHPP